MTDRDVAIIAAKRTAVGSLNGGLVSFTAQQLGAHVIDAVLVEAGMTGDQVDEVILGQVLTGGSGQNPARQSARNAGIHDAAPAMTINQVCGSGLRAVALGAQQILTDQAEIVVAGGQESMSNAPHVAVLRHGKKFGDLSLRDSMAVDGLSDAFYGYPMGNTAENIARDRQISRDAQDTFAIASHQKASAAIKAGRFASEITPIIVKSRKSESTFAEDEFVRHDASAETMARLRPAFLDDGTVTAGNSSGINDGAAALVLASRAAVAKHKLQPMAWVRASASAGVDPAFMGLGPIPASRKALERAGWSVGDVDLWEINEAFAAQSLAAIADLGIDPERINVNGGAIAIGHPIGASGARVLTTLLHEMVRRDAKRGVATLCIGGGMGVALCVERESLLFK